MSQLLTLTGSVTRTELALAALNLEVEGAYRVTSIGPGGRLWRRQLATSRYMHGRALVHAVLEQGDLALGVRCYSTTGTGLNNNTVALIEAFSQRAYDVTVVIEGATQTWRCEPADLQVTSGEWDKYALAQHQQEYTLIIPRNPVPTAGAL